MHKLFLVLGLLASVAPSLAAVAASSVEVHRYDGEVNRGSYIVKVRDGARKSDVLHRIGSFLVEDSKVTHDWNSQFFNGFAGSSFRLCASVAFGPNQIAVGNFDGNVIEVLKSSIDVEYIAEDGIMTAFDVQYVEPSPSVRSFYSNRDARNDAPWNLARVSTRTELAERNPFSLDYEYQYLPDPGRGVNIYVVDTGSFDFFPVRFHPESV